MKQLIIFLVLCASFSLAGGQTPDSKLFLLKPKSQHFIPELIPGLQYNPHIKIIGSKGEVRTLSQDRMKCMISRGHGNTPNAYTEGQKLTTVAPIPNGAKRENKLQKQKTPNVRKLYLDNKLRKQSPLK